MKNKLKLSLIAGLLVAAGTTFAQVPAGMQGEPGMGPGMGMRHEHMGKPDLARLQAMIEKHDALLKAQLKITPNQEGAWKAFVDAKKPAPIAANLQRPDPIEMAKLTTPERLDKIKALREEHMKAMNAAFAKREDATKTFYAALTADQQKVFDAVAVPGQHPGHRMGPRPAPADKF